MTNLYTRDGFIACGWQYDAVPEEHHGYSSVMKSLRICAKEKQENGQEEQAKILELLSRATSMMLTPNSINEPFRPIFQDFQAGMRSTIPDDFTVEDVVFFDDILNDVYDPWLRARLADLLWLCKKPRNPVHAKVAINSYLTHPIHPETWHRDVNDCWERATRLALQIKDFDRLSEIKSQLFSAFSAEHPSSTFMPLWLASLLDKLQLDRDYKQDIAPRLFQLGHNLKSKGDFDSARSYFELAAKKYQQLGDEQGWIESLAAIADCFEQLADSRSVGSNLVANSFYENAIQAYRRIPIKYRDTYGIESKMKVIRSKITDTGKASLDEMGLIRIPGVDISEITDASIAHVAGKNSLKETLMYFTGLYSGPEYNRLSAHAKESMQQNFFSNFFDSFHMSGDGRVVAKTPSANLGADQDDPANQAVLHRQVQRNFGMEIQLVVKGQILPALRQLLMEHRVTIDFVEAICHQSPLVPEDRIQLIGYGLWLGFEHDFGNAIHLLCPQVENMVRVQLKQAGAHTSNIDREGIENENGLSTLMEMLEATEVFGEDLAFEIKSVFTDALGFNLRNEVAHGLLNDNTSSISTIYAWWMILRIVIRSITSGKVRRS